MSPSLGLELAFAALAGMAAWLGTGWLYRRAARLRLIEMPNARSSHSVPTPSGGGLAILGASLPVGFWLFTHGTTDTGAILIAALGVALVGLWDDLRSLPKSLRLATQIAACAVLAWSLAPTSGAEPGAWVPMLLGGLLFMITGVWWINLFNFMDGIDGIAASQALVMLGAAILAGLASPEANLASPVWGWMLALAAACLGFLGHNWAPARIFMGDTGSTYLAYALLAVAALSVQEGWLTPCFWLILGAPFIADSSITLLTRMLTGQPWSEAHRLHAYQRLARHWQSHAKTSLLVIGIDCLWLTPLAWLALARPDWAVTLVLLAYAPLAIGVVALGAGRRDA